MMRKQTVLGVSLACALSVLGGVEGVRTAAMEVLPVGAVRPTGWLATQLRMQADGLTGHAEELYADIGKSDWLTGANKGGQYSWERGPYYAKGLLSHAFALDDETLKARAKKWVEAVLASQLPNGDFGPKRHNWWANMISLWMLRDWAEATDDARVVPFLERYFAFQREEFKTFPLAADSAWAQARAGDEMDVAVWLWRKTGKAEWLDFAKSLCGQSADWTSYYRRGGDPGWKAGYRCHIVNFMQGLKTPALQWLLTGDEAARDAYRAAFADDGWIMRQYGRPDRMVNGSEPLADRSATQGTELCAIAERILSCQTVLSVLGDADVADDLETVAYNALPATIAADGRGIRYYCVLNLPACEDKNRLFANNGWREECTGSVCPGPHAGFGCCRSNFHLAWPKFVQSMWMAREGGLAAVAYGTCTVTTPTAVLDEAGSYPFGERVTITVRRTKTEGWPLFVRVPRWCSAPEVTVNGERVPGAKAGAFVRVARTWKAGDVVALRFPMKTEVSFWDRAAAAVMRGPILYAFRPASEERKVKRYKVPYENEWIEDFGGDFPRKEILPKEPWNWALALRADGTLPIAEIAGTGPETTLRVKGIRTDFGGWGCFREGEAGRAIDPPMSPLPREGASEETLTLVPFAATQVRISLFPWIKL